jgi:hypothetical protein
VKTRARRTRPVAKEALIKTWHLPTNDSSSAS